MVSIGYIENLGLLPPFTSYQWPNQSGSEQEAAERAERTVHFAAGCDSLQTMCQTSRSERAEGSDHRRSRARLHNLELHKSSLQQL